MKFNDDLEEIKLYDHVVTSSTERLMLALGGYCCSLACCIADKQNTYKSHNHCLGKDAFN